MSRNKDRPSTLVGGTNRIGEMVRMYRTMRNMTMRDLAKDIGIAHATVMRIEHGKAFDTHTLLKVLHWALDKPKALL